MPNYSDHDFPVPNYLLSVSCYMILQGKSYNDNDDELQQINQGLSTCSTYDQVNTTDTNDSADSVLDRFDMFTDYSVDDLYDIIVSQASTQLNLKTNKSELIEMITAEGEIKDHCAPNEENIEKIFQSISSILKTRLTVINLSSNNCSNYESDNCHNEAPIYVCTTNQPLSFSLPIFRKESSLKFSSLIKDPSTLKLDNIDGST